MSEQVVSVIIRLAPGAVAGLPTPQLWNSRTPCGVDQPFYGVSPIRLGVTSTSRRQQFWGAGRIHGTVRIEDQPASRKVRLLDGRTGLLLGETWSGSDGAYQFDMLDPQRDYWVVAHDHQGQFNAVIADAIRPEVVVTP